MTNHSRGPRVFLFIFCVALIAWVVASTLHRYTSANDRTRAKYAMPTCTFPCLPPACSPTALSAVSRSIPGVRTPVYSRRCRVRAISEHAPPDAHITYPAVWMPAPFFFFFLLLAVLVGRGVTPRRPSHSHPTTSVIPRYRRRTGNTTPIPVASGSRCWSTHARCTRSGASFAAPSATWDSPVATRLSRYVRPRGVFSSLVLF